MPVIGELKTLITGNSASLERAARKGRLSLGGLSKAQRKNRLEMKASGTAMTAMVGKLAGLAAAYIGVRKAVQLVTDSIKRAGQEQLATKVFANFFGSENIGQQLDAQLRTLAVKSPFQLTELREGASMLSAFVEDANDLVPTVEMLGNLAAGTNSNFMDLARTWARNSQLITQQTRDIREWGNRGIDLNTAMAVAMGKNKQQIQDMVKAGKIGFGDVNDALESMVTTGGKFENFMGVVSDTLPGKLSNLLDAFENISAAFGTWLSDTSGLSTALGKVITKLEFIDKLLRSRNAANTAQDAFAQTPAGIRTNQDVENAQLVLGKVRMFGRRSTDPSMQVLENTLKQAELRKGGAFRRYLVDKEASDKRELRLSRKPPDNLALVSAAAAGLGGLIAKASGGVAGAAGFPNPLDFFGRDKAKQPGPAFAGAAERGSSEAARILTGARQSPAVKEAKKHTISLGSIDRTLKDIARKKPTVGVMDSLLDAVMPGG